MRLRKIVLAGGTGFLGQIIIDHFRDKTDVIIVLSRSGPREQGNVSYVRWDAQTTGKWCESLEGADLLINLSGKSVDCRYTEENKKLILSSRVDATNALAAAVSALKVAPKVWMNAASATIYRHAEDRAMDEFDGESGEGFSVDVCRKWEAAFDAAVAPDTRKITLRISMVLGKEGGVLPVMKKLVKFGLGGKMGDGKQYVSWIHEHDFVAAIEWLYLNGELKGPFNMAAPEPVSNNLFMKTMREVLSVPFGLPAAAWMLAIGAFFIRTETELILKSRRVVPTKLISSGFRFKFPRITEALQDLLN
jgi:uncharacterized protein (TIGR01777 family)